MNTSVENKTTTLEKAIQSYVYDGAHISIGGFTISRNPMAAIHEIIRQNITGLHVYAHSNGQGLDELIGANTVSKVEIAYSGNGRFAPTCLCFRRAVLNATILVEDYTNFQMALRFHAGAMGVPFLPTYSSLGTDIIEKWGFSPEVREIEPKLSNKKLVVMDNPFSREPACEKLVLVPAIQPDVTIIHAQKADPGGCTRIEGLTFADVDQAKAARHVIVTCEELVEPGVLKEDSQANQLPGFCVDAVVHVPFGAYPTACFGAYDYDSVFLETYHRAAQEEATIKSFFDTYVFGVNHHQDLLKIACNNRINDIIANPETGYSEKMKRR